MSYPHYEAECESQKWKARAEKAEAERDRLAAALRESQDAEHAYLTRSELAEKAHEKAIFDRAALLAVARAADALVTRAANMNPPRPVWDRLVCALEDDRVVELLDAADEADAGREAPK